MKKTQRKVYMYYRTNHPTTMEAVMNLEKKARQLGYSPSIVFVDQVNGVVTKPALTHLLTLVRNNKVDVLVTDSQTRFSRNIVEANFIYRILREHKVQVIFLND